MEGWDRERSPQASFRWQWHPGNPLWPGLKKQGKHADGKTTSHTPHDVGSVWAVLALALSYQPHLPSCESLRPPMKLSSPADFPSSVGAPGVTLDVISYDEEVLDPLGRLEKGFPRFHSLVKRSRGRFYILLRCPARHLVEVDHTEHLPAYDRSRWCARPSRSHENAVGCCCSYLMRNWSQPGCVLAQPAPDRKAPIASLSTDARLDADRSPNRAFIPIWAWPLRKCSGSRPDQGPLGPSPTSWQPGRFFRPFVDGCQRQQPRSHQWQRLQLAQTSFTWGKKSGA